MPPELHGRSQTSTHPTKWPSPLLHGDIQVDTIPLPSIFGRCDVPPTPAPLDWEREWMWWWRLSRRWRKKEISCLLSCLLWSCEPLHSFFNQSYLLFNIDILFRCTEKTFLSFFFRLESATKKLLCMSTTNQRPVFIDYQPNPCNFYPITYPANKLCLKISLSLLHCSYFLSQSHRHSASYYNLHIVDLCWHSFNTW